MYQPILEAIINGQIRIHRPNVFHAARAGNGCGEGPLSSKELPEKRKEKKRKEEEKEKKRKEKKRKEKKRKEKKEGSSVT